MALSIRWVFAYEAPAKLMPTPEIKANNEASAQGIPSHTQVLPESGKSSITASSSYRSDQRRSRFRYSKQTRLAIRYAHGRNSSGLRSYFRLRQIFTNTS
jgi:hypothetical protein